MKSATVRELRNEFPRIEAWIREGEAVSITKRGAVVAILTSPSKAVRGRKPGKPDIMARLKETWGNRVFSEAEVAAMRAAELAGEEG
jgi:antitoxin (DNA-binding transcriptional repressor) of toxin-antitoxin stability system